MDLLVIPASFWWGYRAWSVRLSDVKLVLLVILGAMCFSLLELLRLITYGIPFFAFTNVIPLGGTFVLGYLVSSRASLLWSGARRNDLTIVKHVLSRGVDVNLADRRGRTALIEASQKGHEAMVTLLLDKGADPNRSQPNGTTALLAAVRHGHLRIAQRLMDAGANVSARLKNGRDAKQIAARKDRAGVAGLLEERSRHAETTESTALDEPRPDETALREPTAWILTIAALFLVVIRVIGSPHFFAPLRGIAAQTWFRSYLADTGMSYEWMNRLDITNPPPLALAMLLLGTALIVEVVAREGRRSRKM